MDKNLKAASSVVLSSDRTAIWEVLLNPEKIKRFLFGAETITNWNVGSSIIFQGEFQGHPYKDKGVILDVRKEYLLSFSYWSGFSGLEDVPENYSLVAYTLDEDPNGIRLTVTQTGFVNEDGRQHSLHGWKQVLEKIKEIVEQK